MKPDSSLPCLTLGTSAAEIAQVLGCGLPPPYLPVHVLYPHRTHLSRRVRVFIGWVARLLAQAGAMGAAVGKST